MERTVTDAVAVAPAITMPWWLSDLHGLAAELAFWCAVFVAIGRALWLAWDCWDRFRDVRQARSNRSPVNGLTPPKR
ncbi:hypothetical protein [Azospirillum sp. sgz302134]